MDHREGEVLMNPQEKKALALIFILAIGWHLAYGAGYNVPKPFWWDWFTKGPAPTPPIAPPPAAPPPATGVAASLPIQGKVMCVNGTGLKGAIVEAYVDSNGDGIWELVTSMTTSSTPGQEGQFGSGSGVTFTTGQRVLLHVVHGLVDGKKVYGTWALVTIGPKIADLTYHPVGNIAVYVAPSSTAFMDIKLFDSAANLISKSADSPTPLSKSAGQADFKGTIKLVLTGQTWVAFGGEYEEYATNTGYRSRKYGSIVTVEVNRTDIVWSPEAYPGQNWQKVSGTTTTTKYAVMVPRVAVGNEYPATFDLALKLNMASLADDTPVKITIHWYDNSVLADTLNGAGPTTAVSPRPGYTYDYGTDFFVKVVA
ncbi:MAG: hypothetical protein QXG32_00525 [Candidatus Bathyarchaeia archaeon]